MTHGWPGSVVELLETVGPLTDPTAHGGTPEDAFHLVLPSLPGYGFSGEPGELGWDSGRAAHAWAELMGRLGYTRYVAQGGDVGALVTDLMGRQAVEGLVGYHLNLLTAVLAIGDRSTPKESEQGAARRTTRSRSYKDDGFCATSSSRRRGRRRSATRCWIHPSGWRPGCSTTTRTAITKCPARSSTEEPSGNLTRDNHPRQHHAVLADRHRRVGGPVVLGGRRPARRNPRQWWSPWRPRVSTGVAPGRVHCGTGRLVGPQVATPSASERQYQQIGAPCPPTGEPA